METIWETLREFFSTLGTLGKAQGILVPLLASWVFTTMWVYATERKRHGTTRPGRAWLGLFWLPGLLIYYLFQGDEAPARARDGSFTFRRTPKTVEAPRPSRGRRGDTETYDGKTRSGKGSSAHRLTNQGGDDVTNEPRGRAAAPATRLTPRPFTIEVLSGNLKGKRIQSPQGSIEIGIGSRGNNTLRLDDPDIAPWHVLLTFEKSGEWTLKVVEHAKTTPGYRTLVNGRPAKVIVLHHQDEIQLGSVRLRFLSPDK